MRRCCMTYTLFSYSLFFSLKIQKVRFIFYGCISFFGGRCIGDENWNDFQLVMFKNNTTGYF